MTTDTGTSIPTSAPAGAGTRPESRPAGPGTGPDPDPDQGNDVPAPQPSGLLRTPRAWPPEPAEPPVPLSRGRPRRLCRHAEAGALLAADAAATGAVALAAGPGRAAWLLGPLLLVFGALNASGGLYRPAAPLASALDAFPRLLGHAAVAWCGACAALAAVRPGAAVGWGGLAALIAAQAVTAPAARAAVHGIRRHRARRRPRSALVIGAGEAGRRLAAVLWEHPEYGMRPVGLVGSGTGSGTGPQPEPPGLPPGGRLPLLGSPQDVTRAVIQNGVRDAVFARPPDGPADEELVRLFWARGCTVWLVDAEAAPGAPAPWRRRAPAAPHLWGFPCRRLDPPPPGDGLAGAAKRTLDVAVAAAALLPAAPLLAGCALAVRLTDGPGVLFRQERVGRHGRPFVMLKFRTLRPADENESATRWSVAGDRRMSSVGRVLRRTSLDELPQLWNVLRGDMSLVGPRPERPYFVAQFARTYPGYALRHRMPVGITGLAQASGLRGDSSIEDRARFDNHYIDTWSLWQDVCIMLRTTVGCLRPGGR